MTKTTHFFLGSGIAMLAVLLAAVLMAPQAHAAPGDGASSTIQLGDSNSNGKIDQILFEIANPNNETWSLEGAAPYGLSVTDGGLDVTITSVVRTSLTAFSDPITIQVSLDESDDDLSVDTSAAAVELVYTQVTGDQTCTNCIRDAVDEELNAIATGDGSGVVNTETDIAGPVVVSATTTDSSNNGQIDLVYILLSETIDLATFATGDVTVSGYVVNSVTAPEAPTYLVWIDESGSVDTGATPTVAIGSGVIADAIPNTNPASYSAAATDGARPILVSASPASGGSLVPSTINFTLTFSEDLTTSAQSTSNIVITASTGTSTYTLSEASGVVTVNPTGNTFSSGASVTVTVGIGVVDAAGNTYSTAGTLATEPYTFTAITSSGSSGGGGGSSTVDVTADSVTLTSPNGGQSLTAGSTTTITWTSTGNINNVNLDYSLDAGETWTTIAAGGANDGTHTWVVPAVSSASVKVRVVGRDSGGATLFTDTSDAVLAIATGSTSTQTQEPSATASTLSVKKRDGSSVTLSANTLFRGDALSAVYRFNADGTRSVFPNETTFFSWGYAFSGVVFIQDAELQKMTLRDRVTMKPGSYLVKIQTDPKTYEVSDGAVLHHIPDEATAIARHGVDWAKNVRDVPAVFFSDYTIGAPISS